MSNSIVMEANRRLATALGWTNIVDVGNALLGKPTWVCDNSRSQVKVPDWAGDWREAGKLIEQYGVMFWRAHFPGCGAFCAVTKDCTAGEFAETELLAIVGAVCARLEAGQ